MSERVILSDQDNFPSAACRRGPLAAYPNLQVARHRLWSALQHHCIRPLHLAVSHPDEITQP